MRKLSCLLILVAGVSGCASVADVDSGQLDSRLAGPCNRITVSWSVDIASLQDVVGPNLSVRDDDRDGQGEVQLAVLQCGLAGTFRRPLQFAFQQIAVTADSVPLVVTSIPEDGWFDVPWAIADAASVPVLTELGYKVVPAEIDFSVSASSNPHRVSAQLSFDNGVIGISAEEVGDSVPLDLPQALVSGDAEFVSVFFGREVASRYSMHRGSINSDGNTPLSTLRLSETPDGMIYDSGLVADRMFWRVPRSGQ